MNTTVARRRTDQPKINRIMAYALFSAGLFIVAVSAFVTSLVLVIMGLGLAFWGALFLYATPSKHVPLELLNATTISNLTNIEKIITACKTSGKGVYLPPKYLKNLESSLVFIPSNAKQPLPTLEEVDEQKLYSENPQGIFLTPPGLALSKLFEKELGTSFTRTDLNFVQKSLPKLLTEDMEIAEDAEMKIGNGTIIIGLTNHIFSGLCEETGKLPMTHDSLGCPLCSAMACALAKATGKPISIKKEEQSKDRKTTRIQYRILEE